MCSFWQNIERLFDQHVLSVDRDDVQYFANSAISIRDDDLEVSIVRSFLY